MHVSIGSFRWLAVLIALVGLACTPPAPPPAPKSEPAPAPKATASAEASKPAPQPAPSELMPVVGTEPSIGEPLAPVKWVLWGDLETEQTATLFARIEKLQAEFGASKVRVVWRHDLLADRPEARALALAAQAVFRTGGREAFWAFVRIALSRREERSEGRAARWAAEAGVPAGAFLAALGSEDNAVDVDGDVALAKALHVVSTPVSFVNGAVVYGAQPEDRLKAMMEMRLAEAKIAAEKGVPPEKIYADAVEKNWKPLPVPVPPDTTTVWRVPVGKSPVRGNKAAPVTLVMFGDFECMYCDKARSTVAALSAAYGDKLRFVMKMRPLTNHERAEPAAELALEARKQGGDAKFWEAYELLYDNRTKLGDADLAQHAEALHLKVPEVKKAIEKHTHEKEIDEDQNLADDLEAKGTPTFFINGRRLVGAQPKASFQTIIDEEIKNAERLVAAGTKPADVYDAMMKDARGPRDPERIVVPDPTAANPVKGAKAGPGVVTVQVFADFQCQFCKKTMPVLDALMAAHPGKVRLVYRHLPISTHPQAQLAAEAGVEAFTQKGSAGFWAFAALLFEDQSEGALGKEGLLKSAARAGLDAGKMQAALESHVHAAAVKADEEIAQERQISGTPTIAVGDYYVGGYYALRVFERAFARASGKRVEPKEENMHGYKAPASSGDATGPTFGAKHIVVMYKGSVRAAESITRTKAEAKKRAQEFLRRVLKGEKFEDLAGAYSDEPGAGKRGGDLGTFPRGRMVPDFQTAVEATPVGHFSEVVETPFGFHVILRTK